MNKKLIIVAAPPACGKTYISELIARSVDQICYLDKDDLCDLLRTSFAVAGEEVDMDGEFYLNNLRSAEYSTIINIAFSALRFEKKVLLNLPFVKEVRNVEYMKELKARANKNDAELLLIWITAPISTCFERMKKRNSDRDILKLKDWESFVKKTNFNPPYELEKVGAVDRLIVFINEDEKTVKRCLEETMEVIIGE